jgi:AcrR family transcriptional regulator
MNIKTPRINRRTLQAEERRFQILQVALDVFAEKGFKGTSIKDIAEAADISLGLMYHYFASKEALLNATVENHSFLPQMKRILKNTRNRPMIEVFNELAAGFLKLLDSKAGLVKILIREIDSSPTVKKVWSNLVHEGVRLLQEYFDQKVAAGDLRPHNTEITARSVMGILFMYHFTQDVFNTSRVTKEEFIQEMLINIMDGIKANN